jgi:hypothetical protein
MREFHGLFSSVHPFRLVMTGGMVHDFMLSVIGFQLDFPCEMDKYSPLYMDLGIYVTRVFVSRGYEQGTRQP